MLNQIYILSKKNADVNTSSSGKNQASTKFWELSKLESNLFHKLGVRLFLTLGFVCLSAKCSSIQND